MGIKIFLLSGYYAAIFAFFSTIMEHAEEKKSPPAQSNAERHIIVQKAGPSSIQRDSLKTPSVYGDRLIFDSNPLNKSSKNKSR